LKVHRTHRPEPQVGLHDVLPGFIHTLAACLEARDPYTLRHSLRVARIAVALGERMGLPQKALADLYLASMLHDLGKLSLPDSILHKQGSLTEAEYEKVKEHPVVSETLLAHVDALEHLRPLVRHHHERFDGRGYPDRLAGAEIPLLARIMALADGFDAMNSDRPYRQAIPRRKIDQCLVEGSAVEWDPQVVYVSLKYGDDIYKIGEQRLGDHIHLAVKAMLKKSVKAPKRTVAGILRQRQKVRA
jgi:HD-GYP domain-containing protein (c-di-GMP phosphodiesterase class II)